MFVIFPPCRWSSAPSCRWLSACDTVVGGISSARSLRREDAEIEVEIAGEHARARGQGHRGRSCVLKASGQGKRVTGAYLERFGAEQPGDSPGQILPRGVHPMGSKSTAHFRILLAGIPLLSPLTSSQVAGGSAAFLVPQDASSISASTCAGGAHLSAGDGNCGRAGTLRYDAQAPARDAKIAFTGARHRQQGHGAGPPRQGEESDAAVKELRNLVHSRAVCCSAIR